VGAGAADDLVDGAAGRDEARYSGRFADYTVASGVAGWTVIDKRVGAHDGADTLRNVETLVFADRSLALGDAFVGLAVGNILRDSAVAGSGGALTADLSARLATGALTQAGAVAEIVRTADATTSVATLSYQFFTGKIPGGPGMDYLVSPAGPNPNNLNSAYYQSFSIENRYINFAVNLGKLGEGAARFTADYGTLSLFDATKKAYGVIFGSVPTDAKVHALLDPTFVLGGTTMTRADYFNSYGQDGLNGQGTKAAMVGWLLAEAEKADLGVYARSNATYLADLADGAAFALDLVGTYGKPEYAFLD
jgi:serralysin